MNKFAEIAERYRKYSEYIEDGEEYSRDIYLEDEFVADADHVIIAFYTYQDEIFCITDDGMDTDPGYWDDETIEKFIKYLSDPKHLFIEDGHGNELTCIADLEK